jgi:hypothetical protein
LTLDIATIDRLLHPNYLIVQPDGVQETKAQTLASLQSGNRHWDVAESDELAVRLYGNTAVVTGRWRGRGHNGAIPFDYRARFLSIWVCEGGAWHNVAYMATELE